MIEMKFESSSGRNSQRMGHAVVDFSKKKNPHGDLLRLPIELLVPTTMMIQRLANWVWTCKRTQCRYMPQVID